MLRELTGHRSKFGAKPVQIRGFQILREAWERMLLSNRYGLGTHLQGEARSPSGRS